MPVWATPLQSRVPGVAGKPGGGNVILQRARGTEMRQEDLALSETGGFQPLRNGPERRTLQGAQPDKKWSVSKSCPFPCCEEHLVLSELKAQPKSDSLFRGQVVCFSHLAPFRLRGGRFPRV